jgi:hypothetical protein
MGSVTAAALACTLTLAHAPNLVRFAPALHTVGQNASVAHLDTRQAAQELGRELGGTPQMVKAILPPASQHTDPARTVAVHRRARRTPPPARLADLRVPPMAPPPGNGALLIMTTAWTDTAAQTQIRTRFVVTFAQSGPQQQLRATQPRKNQPPPVLIPAYAVVPTPDGWLVIHI